MATLPVAWQFSFGGLAERYYKKNGRELSFGCHGWQHIGRDFYIKLFAELGYDLKPFEHLMRTDDLFNQDILLSNFLAHRLEHRLGILTKINHRGLLLSIKNDSPIVAHLLNLTGGGEFVSFWQEYRKSSAALLRRISRPTVKRLINLGLQ